MPFNATQLAVGANYQLDVFAKNDPLDQVNTARPFLDFLIKNKQEAPGGNQFYVEQLYISNDSNYQNYFGSQQVTYNERDGVRQAKFAWYNFHDGFGFDEDRLAANGIILTDDREAVASGAEKLQLTNLLQNAYRQLKEGIHEKLDEEFLRDGAYNANACPGLSHLVSTTPGTGTVGGLDAGTFTWWRNNANTAINTSTAGTLVEQMEITWRACTLYGGSAPDYIMASAAFIDAYRKDAKSEIDRQINVAQRGGTGLDPSISGLFFKGVPIVWNPTLDVLDAKYGAPAVPFAKRCYFINSRHIKLRPVSGHWMTKRKPERMYDRYVHYWGMTSKYRLTTNKRNAHAVLSIA